MSCFAVFLNNKIFLLSAYLLSIYLLHMLFQLQLQDELDEIMRQLDARQGSYGNSLASVMMIVQAFIQLEKLADLIGERFKDFVGTADKMIKDRHYDSRRIRHEMDETEKRWNTVYNTIKSYRIALEASTKFFNVMGEVCITRTR